MKKALFVPVLLALIWGYGEASKEVDIEGVRFWSSARYTRVVVDVAGPLEFTRKSLSDPDRLYFDLRNSILSKKVKTSLPVKDGILKNVRIGQFNKDTVRVVLDLQEFDNFNVFILKDPYRLVIDVFGKKRSKHVFEKGQKKGFTGIKRVVIDPGHGGKDPGAIGPGGLLEKDVVLVIAKKLGKILHRKYGMEVVYTRNRDVFIPLEERTAIANSKNADLFVSIHVNSSRGRAVRGIETYFLNWTTNRESMKVAARENAISVRKMQELKGEIDWLTDLVRENKKQESMRLAGNVQKSLIETLARDYKGIMDLGVNWALFYVLVGAEMPSILVETSFISNRIEERRLSTVKYQEKIAEAIASGIHTYISPSRLVRITSGNI